MNRRTFLKSIAIACGAAVVCPGELLKKNKHPGIDKISEWQKNEAIRMWGKDGCFIEGERTCWPKYYAIYDEPASPRDLVYFKNVAIPYLRNLPV